MKARFARKRVWMTALLASAAAWMAVAQSPGGGGAPFRSNAQTRLLFPYVINQAGFDTEFAISNTTMDPLGTTAVSGTCTFTFYGNGAGSPFTTPSIAAGSIYKVNLSAIASGMGGYAFATCNFPLAHANYTVLASSTNIHSAMSALVVPSTRTNSFAEQLLH